MKGVQKTGREKHVPFLYFLIGAIVLFDWRIINPYPKTHLPKMYPVNLIPKSNPEKRTHQNLIPKHTLSKRTPQNLTKKAILKNVPT